MALRDDIHCASILLNYRCVLPESEGEWGKAISKCRADIALSARVGPHDSVELYHEA